LAYFNSCSICKKDDIGLETCFKCSDFTFDRPISFILPSSKLTRDEFITKLYQMIMEDKKFGMEFFELG